MSEEDRERRESSEARDPQVEEIELDPDLPPEILKKGIEDQHTYSMLGLVLGAIIVAAGVVLIVLGFTGAVDITFQSGKTKGHVVTGSLGVVLALIGAVVVYVTRFKVEIRRSPKNG